MIMYGRKSRAILFFVVIVGILVSGMAGMCARKPSLNSQLKNLQGRMKSLEHKIRQKKYEKKTVLTQLETVQLKLEVAQSSLSANKLRLLDAQSDLDLANQRLARTRRELERRQELLSTRIVDMYEGEDLTYVNVVLGADDTWTFLTRSYYLQKILDSDSNLIDDIKKDKAQIESDKARIETRIHDIRGLHTRLEAQRNEVSGLADAKRDQLVKIESSKDLYEKAYEELMAKSREIERKLQSYYAGSRGYASVPSTFSSGLSMPCRGKLSSRFGYRVHPITGVYKLHTGIDIAVPSGTPIRAAADGVCIMSGWINAYGYTVVIDHGGRVSTLYAHNSRLLVREGQKVRRGQTIAKAGSTGYSTGPHCHFEKRVNGKPVNPL